MGAGMEGGGRERERKSERREGGEWERGREKKQ